MFHQGIASRLESRKRLGAGGPTTPKACGASDLSELQNNFAAAMPNWGVAKATLKARPATLTLHHALRVCPASRLTKRGSSCVSHVAHE